MKEDIFKKLLILGAAADAAENFSKERKEKLISDLNKKTGISREKLKIAIKKLSK